MNSPKSISVAPRYLKPFLITLGLLCANERAIAQTTVVMTPVAEVGDSAPGTASNWSALSLSYAAVGTDGGVAFVGTAGGLEGAWFGDPGSLELAGIVGDAAPGTLSTFNDFTNSNGITPVTGFGVAFHNRLADTNMSFWTASSGPVLNLLAMEGAAIPDATANFTTLNKPSINNDGNSVFRAQLDAGGTRTLWFSPAAGPAASIARNTEAMSAIGGTTYNGPGANYSANDNDAVSFTCSLLGAGANDQVLLSLVAPAGAPVLVAREGDITPGPGTTEPFATFPDCHINDSGDILFDATLGGAALAHNNTGVWLYDAGTTSLSEVAVEGDAVPGVAGAFFHDFQELFLANNGVLAIVAVARDTANNTGSLIGRGVWIDAGGGLELVALVGENAFEKDGVTVFGPVTSINQVTMSMDGDLALEMNGGSSKGVWYREATVAATTRLQIALGDKTYDGNRQVRIVSGVDLPEAEVFTPSGGGPLGRARSLRNDGVPLLHVKMNSDSGSYEGLYFAERQALNFFITSTSEQAPGAAVGTEFESIRPAASMSENALVAMRGYLRVGTGGTALADSQGIWAEELVGGVPQLTLIARSGEATPGGDTYGQLPVNPIFNTAGDIAFPAELDGGGNALIAGPIGSLVEIAKTGELVGITGIPSGALYEYVRSTFAYNDNGNLVAGCTLRRDSGLGITVNNDSAILRHGLSPRAIAREGASVGAGAAGVFDHLLNRPVLINSAGRVAFLANRKRNPALSITTDNATAVCYHNGSSLICVAAGGAVAVNPGGVQYLKPSDLTFNNANRIGFRTTLQGGGVTPGVNDVALYSSNAGAAPVLLVRTGTTQLSGFGPAGVDPAATFIGINRPDSDAASTLVFRATLTVGAGGVIASDDEGIWTNAGAGTTALLLRKGGAAPDASGVASTAVFESFDDPVISLDGRVVVGANLRIGVGGITADTNRAIFVSDSAGVFYRVVQEGQLMDVAVAASLGGGTSSKAIVEVGYPNTGGGAGGFYKAINSEGFVMTYLTFEDGETASMVFLVP